MKTRIFTASLLLAVCQSFTGNCLALTPVEENFNAKTLDTTRWELAQFENAKLRQSRQRLNFLIGPATHPEEDYAYLELRDNQPGFNENWQVLLDVSNTAGHGDHMGIGFWIYNADDPSDVVFFEFYGNKTKKPRTSVSASFVLDGIHTAEDLDLKPKVTSGKLKITFNKQTKLFTFFFGKRVPKVSGKGTTLVWQRVGTFSPTGKGGNARANWNMNPASGRFGIRLEGYGENKLVGAGEAFMDNFVLKALK